MLAIENEGKRFLQQEKTSFSKKYKFDLLDLQKNVFVSLNLQFSKCIVPNSRERKDLQRGEMLGLKPTIWIKRKYFDKGRQNK